MSRVKRIQVTKPIKQGEKVETVRYGTITGKIWLQKEEERIKEADPKRKPTVDPYKDGMALFADEPQRRNEDSQR